MHEKTDSELTSSLAPSSPDNARRPVYYVQSPSRDSSNDGEKTTASFHSTPVLSPTGSPPHSHSSVGRHSRESSSSRFSGSRKIPPNDHHKPHHHHRKGHHNNNKKKPWKQFDAIEEERLLDDDDSRKSLPRRCYFLAFVLGFFVLFSLFSLILWGASRPQKPKITMKSITFDRFVIQAGSDNTGVATEMAYINSTVKLTYRNTATFFGVHVSSTPLDLSYSELTIASGAINKFYQSRKSQRTVSVSVIGNKVPLYGGGASLSSTNGVPDQAVPLKLNFAVRSRAYVLGKLVKPKFYRRIDCSVLLLPKTINVPISLKKSCSYA